MGAGQHLASRSGVRSAVRSASCSPSLSYSCLQLTLFFSLFATRWKPIARCLSCSSAFPGSRWTLSTSPSCLRGTSDSPANKGKKEPFLLFSSSFAQLGSVPSRRIRDREEELPIWSRDSFLRTMLLSISAWLCQGQQIRVNETKIRTP